LGKRNHLEEKNTNLKSRLKNRKYNPRKNSSSKSLRNKFKRSKRKTMRIKKMRSKNIATAKKPPTEKWSYVRIRFA
jgi:hypothetical protein